MPLDQSDRQCLEEFLDRLRHVSDRNVDTFELYVLKNIFRVPKDLPLRPAPTADQVLHLPHLWRPYRARGCVC